MGIPISTPFVVLVAIVINILIGLFIRKTKRNKKDRLG